MVLVTVVLLCLFIAIGHVFDRYDPEAKLAWYSTLLGTLFGVGITAFFSLWLFFFQSEEKDQDRRIKLKRALAGETQSVLDILQNRPTQVPGVDIDENSGPILVPLPRIVATEAVRSGLFDAERMLFLSNLIGNLQVYNDEVFFILFTRVGFVQPESLRIMIEELNQRRGTIIENSTALLARLESEGIQTPNASP